MTSKRRMKRYQEKNRHFSVWIPDGINAQFEDYLQQFCQGDTKSARFRVFLVELLALQERGITLVQPIKAYEAERKRSLQNEYGADNPEQICFRLPTRFKELDPKNQSIQCRWCKDTKQPQYEACQQERAELRKKSLGLNP